MLTVLFMEIYQMTRKPKPYPFIRNMKKITMLLVLAIAFSLLSSGANNSYAAEVLRILGWEGYFPKEKIDEFESYITKKYGKAISIKIQTAGHRITISVPAIPCHLVCTNPLHRIFKRSNLLP